VRFCFSAETQRVPAHEKGLVLLWRTFDCLKLGVTHCDMGRQSRCSCLGNLPCCCGSCLEPASLLPLSFRLPRYDQRPQC